eukprot:CAMPEP_0117672338 /NCGR_PEP_ID=MMETSP0804-20121206/13847_1 /TAXON_ID=1074897 /ORGANISM="Tetraselmis astigmatica, Strain CCMP880" /LENGTH=47 /DNA_ID= /DNA_START= /DNA_END= /DNA_ORIENTATION=
MPSPRGAPAVLGMLLLALGVTPPLTGHDDIWDMEPPVRRGSWGMGGA